MIMLKGLLVEGNKVGNRSIISFFSFSCKITGGQFSHQAVVMEALTTSALSGAGIISAVALFHILIENTNFLTFHRFSL